MSRSRKKPIIKDKNAYMQKLANRKVRRNKYDTNPRVLKNYTINRYDISDFRFFSDSDKAFRK